MTFEQFTTRLDDMVSFRCSKVANIDDLDKIADICYECKLKECYDHDIYSYTGFYDKYVVVENGGYEIAVFDIDIVKPETAASILRGEKGVKNPTRIASTGISISMKEEWYPTLVDEIEICCVNVGQNSYHFVDQYGGYVRWVKNIIVENNLSFEDTLLLNDILTK